MIVAAGAVGWLAAVLDDDGPRSVAIQPPTAQTAPAQTAPVQDIQRAGQVAAVTQNSLTTRGPDGQVTTFAITPDTTHIARAGAPTTFAAGAVAPTQNVVVMGVVDHGVPVATLVADPAVVTDPAAGSTTMVAAGPPMDFHLPT